MGEPRSGWSPEAVQGEPGLASEPGGSCGNDQALGWEQGALEESDPSKCA